MDIEAHINLLSTKWKKKSSHDFLHHFPHPFVSFLRISKECLIHFENYFECRAIYYPPSSPQLMRQFRVSHG